MPGLPLLGGISAMPLSWHARMTNWRSVMLKGPFGPGSQVEPDLILAGACPVADSPTADAAENVCLGLGGVLDEEFVHVALRCVLR